MKMMYPNLIKDPTTGEDYPIDHPAMEGIATIWKIKLDEFDNMNKQIEESKQRCLKKMGYTSMEDIYSSMKHKDSYVGINQPSTLTLGDFMTVTPQKKQTQTKT